MYTSKRVGRLLPLGEVEILHNSAIGEAEQPVAPRRDVLLAEALLHKGAIPAQPVAEQPSRQARRRSAR